jgi:N-acyl-D-aspartate/D-glutamate deacylase
VFARYVRTGGVLELEEAVRKMTSLAAANTGIEGRGVIRTGFYADLVLFDPGVVADRATPEDPQSTSVGIEIVWVNGVVVYRDEAGTGHYPGVVIRRAR